MIKTLNKIREMFLSGGREHAVNWKRSFLLIWESSRLYTVAWAFLLVLQGILPGLLVYLTKLVVDNLVVALKSPGNWEQASPAVMAIGAMVVVMLLTDVSQTLLEMVRSIQADIIQDHVKGLVHSKSAKIDMAQFESPDYHDRLEQATSDGANRPLSLLESIGSGIQNTITLCVLAGLLLQYSVWLPVVLLITTLPAFVIVLRFDRVYHRWWRGTTSSRRWTQYFDQILTHGLSMAELRIFDLNPYFQSKFQNLRKVLREEKNDQMRRLSLAKILSSLFSLAILAGALGFMGWRAISGGLLTLGDLALFYQAFSRGQGLVRTLFSSIGQMVKNSMFLSVLFEYLDLESSLHEIDSVEEPLAKLEKGISVRDLTFRYPGTTAPIFEKLSIFIPAGKSIAIVGENGSGKTTLFKLLCRFYDPEEGVIEYDGIDIKRFSVKGLHRSITIMFQLPLPYHATVREAIKLGDWTIPGSSSDVETAAKNAGAHDFITRLPEKYDTLLGRAYANGAELSGGQWQRLALARAYYRKAPLVLLDEPTSFLDSWAESNWFRLFRNLSEHQTAVVITHRLNIAMRADLIYVMDKGRIVESGTHNELMESDGRYATSWNDQISGHNEKVDGRENSGAEKAVEELAG